MIIGRSEECGRLIDVLTAARGSRASTLVLRGEPGIGKTCLIEYLIDAATDFRVLRVQGHEAEVDIPFAGLGLLAAPVMDALDKMPAAQAAALAGALRMGPSSGGDRLAIAAAVLSLISSVAVQGPLLITVDDAHWIDLPSLEAIAFSARRLYADPVALIMSARTQDEVGKQINSLLSGLPDLELGGLLDKEARILLEQRGLNLSAATMEVWLRQAAGNPLALLEGEMSDDWMASDEPLRVGNRLEGSFVRRIEALPAAARLAMLVVAAAGPEGTAVLPQVYAAIAITPGDLEFAEQAGLVTVRHGTVDFVHPLLGSAVYHTAAPADRRAVHRALADAFGQQQARNAIERRARHLAAAGVGTDAATANVLALAADDAAERRSYATAVQMLRWSAQFTEPGDIRARRLVRAADLTRQSGQVALGTELVDLALAEAQDRNLITEAHHLRCRIEMWRGCPVAARDRLLVHARETEPDEPVWAAIMRAHAALLSVTLGDQEAALNESARAEQLLYGMPDDIAMPALVIRAHVLAISCEPDQARSLLRRCEPALLAADPLAPELLHLVAALANTSLEDHDQALRWLEFSRRAAEAASAIGLMPFLLSWLALEHWRGGSWSLAYSHVLQAVQLAEETGWLTELPNCLSAAALIEAAMGRADECCAHARRGTQLAAQYELDVVAARCHQALGLLDLSLGRAADAVGHFRNVGDFAAAHGLGDPALLSWGADLADALVAAGESDQARPIVEAVQSEARRSGRPTQHAVAARAQALLGGDDDTVDAHFTSALAWHDQAIQPFQRARTELRYGQALRRRGRRREAREYLRAACGEFERLGAAPWLAGARHELRATGVTVGPPIAAGRDQLTAQELRVALAVVEGASNAEAATQLFLSTKTVEYHLSNVFRKLGIRSRSQLGRAIA